MEQQYVEELKKLKFNGDIDSVPTVLTTYADHNTYDDITDSSHIILRIPTCYDTETEKDIFDKLSQLLKIVYDFTVQRTHFPPAQLPGFSVSQNTIQMEFSGVLPEQELIEKFLRLTDIIFDCLHHCYLKLSSDTPEDKREKSLLTRVGRRIRVIQTFILAGSTSYEYTEQHYDPLS